MQRTKRIISVIVAMLMVLTVMVPMASAADFSDVASDHKYYTAISNLSAYGILDGFEDGSFHPDDKVTRAQFAKIICHALNSGISTTGPVETGFTDVAPEHWAAGNIKMAAARGIINGMGDGTFAPEANIKFEQAVKMIVCALGYGNVALSAGGYPQGYINVASDLKLLKGLAVEDNRQGTDATRGAIAKLVDTMLVTEQLTMTGEQGSSIKDQTVKTESQTGQVVSVYGSTIFVGETSDCSRNQIELLIGSKRYKYSVVELDGVKENINDYLGKRVTVYYDAEDEVRVPTLTKLSLQARKNIVTVIDLVDIEDFSDSTIEYIADADSGDTEEISVDSDANILKNGVATEDDLSEIIVPDAPGQITFIDSDANGNADVVFVKIYSTMIVKSKTASAFKLLGENSEPLILDEDLSTITISKNDKASTFSSISTKDVVSYAASAGNTVIDVLVSSKSVSGTITQMRTNGQIKIKTSSGETTYRTSAYFDDNSTTTLEVGLTGKFYVDAFGKIAKVEVTSSTSYTYAYLVDFANLGATTTPEYAVQVIKINGTSTAPKTTYNLATKFKIDGVSFSDTDDFEDIENVFKTSATAYDPGFEPFEHDSEVGQVIKFTTNSSGKIDKIFTVEYENDDDNKLNITEKEGAKCTTAGQRLDGTYNISGAKVLVLSEDGEGKDKITGSSNSYFKTNAEHNVLLIDLDENFKTPVVVVYGSSGSSAVQWEDHPPMAVAEVGEEYVDEETGTVVYVSVIKSSGETAKYYESEDSEGILSAVEIGDVIRLTLDSDGFIEAMRVTTTLDKMLIAGKTGGQDAGASNEGSYDTVENAEYRQIFGTVKSITSETLLIAKVFGEIAENSPQELITIKDSTKVILIDSSKIGTAAEESTVSVSDLSEIADSTAGEDASKVLIYTSGSQTAKAIFVFK